MAPSGTRSVWASAEPVSRSIAKRVRIAAVVIVRTTPLGAAICFGAWISAGKAARPRPGIRLEIPFNVLPATVIQDLASFSRSSRAISDISKPSPFPDHFSRLTRIAVQETRGSPASVEPSSVAGMAESESPDRETELHRDLAIKTGRPLIVVRPGARRRSAGSPVRFRSPCFLEQWKVGSGVGHLPWRSTPQTCSKNVRDEIGEGLLPEMPRGRKIGTLMNLSKKRG